LQKRVCFLTSAHPPFDVRVYHKEAKTLVAAGYEVTIVVPHAECVCASGVQIRAVSPPVNRWERLLIQGRIWRVALAEKADVYHLQDPELVPLGFMLKVFGKKVVYDVHEDLHEDILIKDYVPRTIRYPLAFISDVVEKLLSRSFEAILPATDGIAAKFNHCKRVIVLRNYPRLAQFASSGKRPQPHPEFRCAYIGCLTAVRGISELVQAMGSLSDTMNARLVLCGKFESERYERDVRAEDGFQKTDFLGWVDYRQVPDLLATVDAGMVCVLPLPHFLVGLPLKLFEYMAAGLPVIASNFPLWREIIESAGCGICVDPQNPMEIAAAIRYLCDHPEERRAMGERGRRAVRERFNWEEEGKKLISVYQELLGVGRSPQILRDE